MEEEDRVELGKFTKFLESTFSSSEKSKQSISIESDAVAKLIMHFAMPIKHSSFLTEMTLSYLISYQEAMLKDYLYGILINRKSALKCSNKITYEDVLNFTSMKPLIAHLAQKEVDLLGYGSIDDVAKYYNEKFNIDFTKFEKWTEIVEFNFRRNLIIHNKGVTNDQYCKRVGHKKKGVKLHVSIEYVVSVAESLLAFNEFCLASFVAKFKLA